MEVDVTCTEFLFSQILRENLVIITFSTSSVLPCFLLKALSFEISTFIDISKYFLNL